jgi:hypothetical protein
VEPGDEGFRPGSRLVCDAALDEGPTHLLVLPRLIPEHEDAVVSIVAGVAYLGLALADWRFRDSPATSSPGR